jgi:hypothetical protein
MELGRAEALLPIEQDFPALREALELARDPGTHAELSLELGLALFAACLLRSVASWRSARLVTSAY